VAKEEPHKSSHAAQGRFLARRAGEAERRIIKLGTSPIVFRGKHQTSHCRSASQQSTI
jgi:hypothetical protein